MEEYTGEEIEPKAAVKRGFLGETAAAVPRVIGGIAEAAGKTIRGIDIMKGKTVSPSDIISEKMPAVESGIINWGKRLQEKYAIQEENRAAHPFAAKAADLVEGAAKIVPLVGASVAVGNPLPFVAGFAGEQYDVSYQNAIQRGMPPEEARRKAMLPATIAGAGAALMGPAGKAAQTLIRPAATAAEALGGGVGQVLRRAAVGTLADTGVMTGQQLLTSAAEKTTGIRPEAEPIKETLSPEALASSFLTAGMFQGVGTVKGLRQYNKMKSLVADAEAPIEQRLGIADHIERTLRKTDPEMADKFGSYAKDAIINKKPLDLGGSFDKPLVEQVQAALEEKIDNPEVNITDVLEKNVTPKGEEYATEIR